MEFKRENPDCKFSIPEKITIRQQMKYFSQIAGLWNNQSLERYWEGARTLIENWDCEIFPDKDKSLEEETNPVITQVLIWAGVQVKEYISSLESTPKN